MAIELIEITDANREAVLALRVAEHQRGLVSTVAESLEQAAEHPEAKPWCRAIAADGVPVGFVQMCWDVTPDPPDLVGPWFLWKLLVDERHQGRGHGAAAVRILAGLVHAEGGRELLTSYVPGDHGPAAFYRRLGFTPTGETDEHGELYARLPLH